MKKIFCKKKSFRVQAGLLIVIVTILLADIAAAAKEQNVTQNWSGAAVFYDAPSDETETFHMTEEEFLAYKTELEAQLILSYSAYCKVLDKEAQESLREAQKAWIDCYEAYMSALEQRWTFPVKIYFGVTGQERRTNVYRETVLLMLINRITDLEEWRSGRLSGMEKGFLAEKTEELKEEKKQLQVDMGLCLYVIQEEYRDKIRASHQKFYAFLEQNQKFLKVIAPGHEETAVSEELLQVQRMSYLTQVQYQGCRFFRREREE